ncbi:MAG: carboxypeptidase-like regulatory domain-containing protein [Caldilineales bacterium]
MRIEDFPRPPDDNGRGIHWSARLYHDVIHPDLDTWIERLQAMKIKWVKLLDDGGGSALGLSRRLLAAGMMPIVRIYMAQLNPHLLGSRELDTVSRYVAAGVRYFESNNEPDLPAEWQNGQRPANWLDIVINNFIRDADAVLARGGLLALPAMGPGALVNPVALVASKGRRDLFERGCWIAVHNYTLNHPLDYPFDAVNQSGEPISQQEFNRLAAWQYSDLTYAQIVARHLPITQEEYNRFNRWAWDGRTREQVNAVRAAHKNPGHTLHNDANCFLGYRLADEMAFAALGFHVPVISTEGGPVVGWGDDDRYAKMNPTTQAAYQLEIVRHMANAAPDWYFACCTWLLAARPLGDFNPTWEQMAWYTGAWDGQFGLHGTLPVVQALTDEPSTVRPGVQTELTFVTGVAQCAGQAVSGLELRLSSPNAQHSATTDAAGAFRFERLAADVYSLHSHTRLLQSGIELVSNNASLHLTLALDDNGAQSLLLCRVCDQAATPQPQVGITLGAGEQSLHHMVSNADGLCLFTDLPRGVYWLRCESQDSVDDIVLDGWSRREITLTLPAPATARYALISRRLLDKAETANRRIFFGRVLDEHGNGLNGITLEMRWQGAAAGTQFPRVTTPRDPFKDTGNFEFSHTPGLFNVQVVQGDYPSDLADELDTAQVPGREGQPISYELIFQRGATAPPPDPQPDKAFAQYWLLPPAAQGADLLGLLLPYLQANGLLAGGTVTEALNARQVTLVGDETNWSAEQEAELRAAGCTVRRLPGDPFALAEVLPL